MFPFSHMFWKFLFLSWIPSSRFLFILAFPFLLQPRKVACQPLLDIFQMLWQMFRAVFWVVLPCKMIVDQSFYTAVQPRRQLWTSYSPPWELEISHYGKWSSYLPLPLCWGVSSHTGHSLIYRVQTNVITDEALLHTECCYSILQLVNYSIVDHWSSNS
jgi:hypothetical protein